MTDHPLIRFLRARLDEDERIARAADGISRDTMLDLYEDLIKSRPLDDQRRAYGIHISQFTSGRILWDIAAKRRILDMHNDLHDCVTPDSSRVFPVDDEGAPKDGLLCPTLRLLALPYARHPDYREEWRL